MSRRHLLLGVDVSTTGSKAVLVDASEGVVGSATTPHTLSTPRPLSVRAGPTGVVAGLGDEHPRRACGGGRERVRGCCCRAHRPDARPGAAG